MGDKKLLVQRASVGAKNATLVSGRRTSGSPRGWGGGEGRTDGHWGVSPPVWGRGLSPLRGLGWRLQGACHVLGEYGGVRTPCPRPQRGGGVWGCQDVWVLFLGGGEEGARTPRSFLGGEGVPDASVLSWGKGVLGAPQHLGHLLGGLWGCQVLFLGRGWGHQGPLSLSPGSHWGGVGVVPGGTRGTVRTPGFCFGGYGGTRTLSPCPQGAGGVRGGGDRQDAWVLSWEGSAGTPGFSFGVSGGYQDPLSVFPGICGVSRGVCGVPGCLSSLLGGGGGGGQDPSLLFPGSWGGSCGGGGGC